ISTRPAIELLIQLFSSPVFDPTGHGQGKTYLGSTTVRTDGNGNAEFLVTLDGPLTPGEFVTSTATDFSRTTSEFSARLPVGSTLTSDVYVVNSTDDSDDGFCDDTDCTL